MIQLCTSVSYSSRACITERTMDSRCTYLQRDMICIRPFPRLSPHLEKRTANRLCESTGTRRTGGCGRTPPGELITAIWIKKSQNPEASEGKLMPPLANSSRLSCSCTADDMCSTRTICITIYDSCRTRPSSACGLTFPPPFDIITHSHKNRNDAYRGVP